MKYSVLAASVVLALSLSACNSDNDTSDRVQNPNTDQPNPADDGNNSGSDGNHGGNNQTEHEAIAEDEVIPQAQVLFEESFADLNTLPAGWNALSNNPGTVSVKDGSLYIDGRNDSYNMTTVMLPVSTQQYSDYRVDVEFTYLSSNNNSRWGSVIYRASEATATPAHHPYYQFAIRSHATADNGTEFSLRTHNQWEVKDKAPFTENIDPTKIYKATVIVQGNRVRQYLNGVLMQDTELAPEHIKGGIGLSATGLEMRVDSIKVTEQLEALPTLSDAVVNVQDSGSLAAVAPTIIETVTDKTNLYRTRASQLAWTLDKQLNLNDSTGKKISTLQEYLADPNRRTLPLLAIKDQATLEALHAIADHVDLSDVTISCSDEHILRQVHALLPSTRSALDLSQATQYSNNTQDLMTIMYKTNNAFARIVILPNQLINKNSVAFLQQRLMTVWVASTANQVDGIAAALVSGANGILTTHSDPFNQVLKVLPRHTLLRKPLVVAHRGVPSLEDENTLEGALKSVALGADAIENDIYITKDDHLVIMHDQTVDRTTQSKGRIEDMTLAQVKQLKTKQKGYQVPSLAEFFEAFKNNKKVVHFIEIKSGNERIVPQLKKEIEKYAIQEQVVTISFDTAQIKRMKNVLPQFSTGFLTGNVPKTDHVLKDVKKLMGVTQSFSSTFNPSFANITPSLMEVAKHRGITIWPWTYRDETNFKKHYVTGTYGLTTDYSQYASHYVVDIQTDSAATLKVGQALNLKATLKTQDGQTKTEIANQYIILSTSNPSYRNSNSISYKSAGTAYVLPGYKYQIDGAYSYTIFGAPVKVTVQH